MSEDVRIQPECMGCGATCDIGDVCPNCGTFPAQFPGVVLKWDALPEWDDPDGLAP